MELSNFQKAEKHLTEYLELKGLRKTVERFAILEEIYARDDHFEAEELYISLKLKKIALSQATVYNTLEVLVEAELIIKHHFGNKISSRYEKAQGRKQQDQLICTDCEHKSNVNVIEESQNNNK